MRELRAPGPSKAASGPAPRDRGFPLRDDPPYPPISLDPIHTAGPRSIFALHFSVCILHKPSYETLRGYGGDASSPSGNGDLACSSSEWRQSSKPIFFCDQQQKARLRRRSSDSVRHERHHVQVRRPARLYFARPDFVVAPVGSTSDPFALCMFLLRGDHQLLVARKDAEDLRKWKMDVSRPLERHDEVLGFGSIDVRSTQGSVGVLQAVSTGSMCTVSYYHGARVVTGPPEIFPRLF